MKLGLRAQEIDRLRTVTCKGLFTAHEPNRTGVPRAGTRAMWTPLSKYTWCSQVEFSRWQRRAVKTGLSVAQVHRRINRDNGAVPRPNLAPNKFQDRLSGACRMQGNFLAVGAPPRTQPGAVVGMGLVVPSPRTPLSALWDESGVEFLAPGPK